MYRMFLSNFAHADLVVVGELLFLAIFIAAVAWVFRPGSAKFYQQLSVLPMEEENNGKG